MARSTPSKSKVAAKAIPVAKPAKATHDHATVAHKTSVSTPGLHYSREDLHDDYTKTFAVFMRMLAIGVLGALVYFFIMIIYLGAFGHTKTDDYVREFGTRVQYDYKGLRLPEYDDPSLLKPVKEAK